MNDATATPSDASSQPEFSRTGADASTTPIQAHIVGALAAFVAALALELILPLGIDTIGGPSAIAVGVIACAVAAGVLVWAYRRIGARVKAMDPVRPETALVTDGPYAWSRNPIQLALALGIVGLSAVFSLDWGVFAAIGYLLWLRFKVIPKEEARMQARFGETWQAYRKRVRRWL